MSNLDPRHPSEALLLEYVDGELAASEKAHVERHLASCWQCRAELEEFQKTIGALVRYRKTLTEDCFPSPNAPWCDIRKRMADADVALGGDSFATRMWRQAKQFMTAPRQWAPVMATIVLIAVVTVQFQNTPTVSAAMLLDKAVVAAQSKPVKVKKIRIRSNGRAYTRLAGTGQSSQTSDLAPLAAKFVAAHYDWNDPLSAQAFTGWREQLAAKTDSVQSGANAVTIATTTDSGDLVSASLTLRNSDLAPVESVFEFRDRERVEISEIPESLGSLAGENLSTPNLRTDRSKSPAAPGQMPPNANALATPSDELRVHAVLRRLGADLGEPVEVTRRDGRVFVSGVGVAPQRQQQIQQELASQPGVVVQFGDTAATAAIHQEGRATTETPKLNSEIAKLQEQMASYLGGRPAFEQFSDQTLLILDATMTRAHALRRVSERFTPEAEAQLSPDDKVMLRQIRAEHANAMRVKLEELRFRLEPVFRSLGVATMSAQYSNGGAWQQATMDVFKESRLLETQLGILLGGASGDVPAPVAVYSNLLQLLAKITAYESSAIASQ